VGEDAAVFVCRPTCRICAGDKANAMKGTEPGVIFDTIKQAIIADYKDAKDRGEDVDSFDYEVVLLEFYKRQRQKYYPGS
jgi:hypothetical protein